MGKSFIFVEVDSHSILVNDSLPFFTSSIFCFKLSITRSITGPRRDGLVGNGVSPDDFKYLLGVLHQHKVGKAFCAEHVF